MSTKSVLRVAASLVLFSTGAIGCYTTTSKADLAELVQRTQGNSFPGQLIYEGSDNRYDYYRIEDFGVGGRYRVPREQTESKRPTTEPSFHL